jgi:hypothetical protein
MIIKLLDELGGELVVETSHNDPDKQVSPGISGDAKNLFIKEIESSYGYYGHTIEITSTSNLDLNVACHKLPSFKLVSIEPKISANSLPDGAIS